MDRLKQNIIRRLLKSRIVRDFMSAPSPQWLVFVVDMSIVAFSCLLTYNFNPTGAWIGSDFLTSALAHGIFVFVTYAVLGLVFRTHACIVRLSIIEDMYRVVKLVVAASVVLACVAEITKVFCGQAYFNVWNVFIVGVLSFSLMLVLRLMIKYVYRALNAAGVRRTRVVVLASGVDSLNMVPALLSEPDGHFDPVAVLNLSSKQISNDVSGVPVLPYDPETVGDVFIRYDSNTLLLHSSQLEMLRHNMADVFLSKHIKLLMLNQVEEVNSESGKPLSSRVRDINIEDLLGREPIHTGTENVERVLRDQIVMITGAAGSIGSEIVNQVATLGARELVLVDQAETPMHELQLQMDARFPQLRVHLFVGDVTNEARMEQAFIHYKPRYVFHAAAYKHVPMMERNPSEAVLTNVFGTKIIADLAVKYKVEKFVMVSTDKAVNPTNVMGASKRIAEIYVQSLFYHRRSQEERVMTRFITTRFGNVLGSNGSVIPLFRRQIEQGGPVTVTHREIIRYFMTIPEACSLVLQAGCMGNGGEIFIFDMGQPVRIYDLATRMISLSGLRPGDDIEIVETGLRPGEKLYEELLNDKEQTLATTHDKIMIAKVRVYDYADVMQHLNNLRKATVGGDYHDIVAEMKRIVPEFKSNNSQWESIDNEITHDEEITEITVS